MQKRILKTLHNERKKIEEKEVEIKDFSNKPLMLFDELQYDRNIIPDLLKKVDESLLLDYQKWQYPMVQREIIKNFNISPFTLDWDDDIFPSPIYLVRNGYRVAAMQPYTNTFEILPNEKVVRLLDEYKTVANRRIKKWEEIEELNAKMLNPFIQEDESLLNTIKVSLTRKKKEEELTNNIELYTQDLNMLILEENTLYRKIEKVSREENINNYEIEKIHGLLRRKLNLRLVNSYDEEFTLVDEKIQQIAKEAELRIEDLQKLVNETEQY